MSATLPFVHRFAPAAPPFPPLLLLHGTGGDENELVPLAAAAAPGAAVLSAHSQVVENGQLRFFRRFPDGTLDEYDICRSVDALAGFVAAARDRYRLARPVAIGFSNGANTAAALLLRHPGLLAGVVLLRAVPPFRNPPPAELDGTPVLVLGAATDSIAPPDKNMALAALLRSCGATAEMHLLACGHDLTPADNAVAREWLCRCWPPLTVTVAAAVG